MAEQTWMDTARFDRIDALLETLLQKYNCSQSSSHGAANSFIETRRQPFQSHFISFVAESSKNFNQHMAEYSREIKLSCTRIIDLLQEEIDASESLNGALPASNEFSPSTKSVEVPSVCETNFMVEVVKPKSYFNGEIMHLPAATTNMIIATTESFGSRNIGVDLEFEHTLELLPRQVAMRLDNGQGELSSLLQNPLKQPCQMIHCNQPSSEREFTIASNGWVAGRWDDPPPPPEPPDNVAVPAFVPVTTITREVLCTGSMRTCLPRARLNDSTPSPPPKPPDRSFQKMTVEFQVTSEPTMPPPPPHLQSRQTSVTEQWKP